MVPVTSWAKSENTFFCEIPECVLWLSGYPLFSVAYFMRQVSAVALRANASGRITQSTHTGKVSAYSYTAARGSCHG